MPPRTPSSSTTRVHRDQLASAASNTPADNARVSEKDATADAPNGAEETSGDDAASADIFIDPMMGTPLACYVEKDVKDREEIIELIERHGGTVSQGYSGVPYILVDSRRESGQSLFRQYAGKKGKLVLDARWVRECINAGELQMFAKNWAGCKVNGSEQVNEHTDDDGSAQAATNTQLEAAQSSTGSNLPERIEHQHQQLPPQPASPQQGASIPPQMPPLAGSQPLSATLSTHPGYVFSTYTQLYPPFTARNGNGGIPGMHPTNWPAPPPPQSGIMPQQTQHVAHSALLAATRSIPPYRDVWDGYPPPPQAIAEGQPAYDYSRYREDAVWPEYYEHQYSPTYPPPEYMQPPPEGLPAQFEASAADGDGSSLAKPRGRKRTRPAPTPATPAANLVTGRRNVNIRSPTPPKRVLKSAYGGNLFTSEDVEYLKQYIDYCQAQGLVLSLREICERVAVKAPHHTFYSWRRYCNKHHIRLGGYAMDLEHQSSPNDDSANNADVDPALVEGVPPVAPPEEPQLPCTLSTMPPPPPVMDGSLQQMLVAPSAATAASAPPNAPLHPPQAAPPPSAVPPPQAVSPPSQPLPPQPTASSSQEIVSLPLPAPVRQDEPETIGFSSLGPGDIAAIQKRVSAEPLRTRSPSPPRALFRSTTGKGVAFTHDDIEFLVRLLKYRESQGKVDMVTFWKDVAAKAPHHSRASWMKFYRRHKHELHHSEGDAPLPPPPEKKLRYSRADDTLLARYFVTRPEGTSDSLFQAFARMHPHHPWKGWQEHHRIHKVEIDHLIQRLEKGEDIDAVHPGTQS